MRNYSVGVLGFWLIALLTFSGRAAVYQGHNNGTIYTPLIGDKAQLELNHNSTTISGTLRRDDLMFTEPVVIYIDSLPGQGFTSTLAFSDNANWMRAAISGMNTSSENRNVANFANGFAADYAIAMKADGGQLFRLVSGGDGSLELIDDVNISPRGIPSSASFSFNFNWDEIGIPGGSGFTFQTAHLSPARRLDSFEQLSGSIGWSTGDTGVTYANFNIYGQPVPEMTNVALAAFGGIFLTVQVIRSRRKLFSRDQVPGPKKA